MSESTRKENLVILRGLLAFVGAIISFVGFMMVTNAWMSGTQDPIGWVVLIIGVIAWIQLIPVMRRTDREQRKAAIRKALD
jgi:uncharacterized membrane protein